MAAHARDNAFGFDVVVLADFLDDVGDGIQFHDLSVDDRLIRKVLESQAGEAVTAAFAFEFDHLN